MGTPLLSANFAQRQRDSLKSEETPETFLFATLEKTNLIEIYSRQPLFSTKIIEFGLEM